MRARCPPIGASDMVPPTLIRELVCPVKQRPGTDRQMVPRRKRRAAVRLAARPAYAARRGCEASPCLWALARGSWLIMAIWVAATELCAAAASNSPHHRFVSVETNSSCRACEPSVSVAEESATADSSLIGLALTDRLRPSLRQQGTYPVSTATGSATPAARRRGESATPSIPRRSHQDRSHTIVTAW